MIYTVKTGDTVYSIARYFGVSPERIIIDNGIKEPYKISIGQSLLVLIPEITHTVQEGETVFSIAQNYGISPKKLFQRNYALGGRFEIYPGETLIITYEGQRESDEIISNTYFYPFVNESTLSAVSPYLSGTIPFTYGFTDSGNLVRLDDENIIRIGQRYSAAPLMHLSTLTPEGVFDNTLSSRLFESPDAMNNLISEILGTIREKGYSGIDVDFEFIPSSDGPRYVEFIRMLRDALAPEGYTVIVALAPKTSDSQRGLLYEGHDYRGLAAAADYVLLMTYEWGYEYSMPMAVAPIRNVRAVLEYALSVIPKEKILLGIPNYGYNWPLPYVSGTTRGKSLGNTEAQNLAAEYNAEIIYDTNAETPYFNYTDEEGVAHEVWFEDARSISAKLGLVREYDIAGIGIWNGMRDFPVLWLLSATEFAINEE